MLQNMRNILFSKLKGEKNPLLIKFSAYSLHCMPMMHFRWEVKWKVLLFASPEATSIDLTNMFCSNFVGTSVKQTYICTGRPIVKKTLVIVIIIEYYNTII